MTQHFNQSAFLEPDKEALERFARAVFKHANPEGYVSARIFLDNGQEGPAVEIEPVSVGDPQFHAVIYERARQAAIYRQPAVFAPPVVTLKTPRGAKADDVFEGVALSIDCDATPNAALAFLREVLGDPTVAVASGGEWVSPDTGERERKVHAHWRLKNPTSTPAEHAQLKQARDLATKLVGADPTAVPLVHPLRWPGSWHRKKEPRLAEIIFESENEIDLSEALALLRDLAGLGFTNGTAAPTGGLDWKPEAGNHEDVASALSVIPNKDMHWRDWNNVGMATWAATAGSEVGARAFMEWSAKSSKHSPDKTRERWDHYRTSPPSRIGFGTLVFMAREADPSWTYGNAGRTKADDKAANAFDGVEPVDMWGKFNPPTLPRNVLPDIIERFAFAQGQTMGADMAIFAASCLAACAAAIPDSVRLQVKKHNKGWTESARLWVTIVGPPSTKKTPAMMAALRPLRKIGNELARNYQAERELYDALSKTDKATQKPPKRTQQILQDTTIEAAQEVFKDSPDGLLVFHDELGGFFGSLDRYSGGKGADRAFWLQSYNGGSYDVNRIGRGFLHIENLSACILGGIQPDPIRKISSDSVDDGLLQRFCIIVARPAGKSNDEPDPPEVDEYATLISRLRRIGGTTLYFDDNAQAYRSELEDRHLELQSCEAVDAKLSAHFGKYDGMFARLCVIFHCIENNPASPVISEKTARRAGTFLHQFLLPHALAFHVGMLGVSKDHDKLEAIAGFILAKGLTRVTARDLKSGVRPMRKAEPRDVETALEQMTGLGWLNPVPGPRTTHWDVNPRAHAKFATRAEEEKKKRARVREIMINLTKSEDI